MKCLLPGCGKEVIHFKQHLKNIHDIGMEQYLKRIPKLSEKQTTYRDPPNQLRSCNNPKIAISSSEPISSAECRSRFFCPESPPSISSQSPLHLSFPNLSSPGNSRSFQLRVFHHTVKDTDSESAMQKIMRLGN